MSTVKHLVFIQPVVTAYRIPLFKDLSDRLNGNFSVYADLPSKDFGVDDYSGIGFSRIIWYRLGPVWMFSLREFFRMWRRGSHFIHYADFKCLSLWLLLLMQLFSSKKVFLHGQGGYKKKGRLATAVYRLAVRISTGYIAYTEWSADELRKRLPISLHSKVSYVNNSLYLEPVESPVSDTAKDILFIGRLRKGSNIEMLLQAANDLKLVVHVVGAGESSYEALLRSRFPDHKYYGAVYDWHSQVEISRNCFVGVYPGDAGLSVVTYLALGLPVVVHNDLYSHMGPEPSYIDSDVGYLFERGNVNELEVAIENVMRKCKTFSQNSSIKFKQLSGEFMSDEFLRII